MALQVADRVLETSTTTGTGALTLAAAVTGFRRFSAVCSVADTCYYTIVAVDSNGNPSGDWECGLGTYSSANTLTRTTPAASSNAGAAVNFAAGTKYVMLDATAGYLGSAYRVGGTDVPITDGGTGASTAAAARTNLGLGTAATLAQAEQVQILVSDPNGSAITTGDGKAYFRIPSRMNGMDLVSCGASVSTVSSSGIPTVQLRRKRSGSDVDMLTTKITIDANEVDSSTAATASVINTSNDDVATGDQIYIDIDVAGTGAKGLIVTALFQLP
jgi:hypothetical protein